MFTPTYDACGVRTAGLRGAGWPAFVLLLCLPALAAGQGPSADWRVTETPSFRIHYPAPFEAWSLRLAARLESIRARVAREVGYAPPGRTDIVITDPTSTANGAALPILGAPRMVLWATAPSSDSVIGHYGHWGEIVAVHEDAHLVHLLRPSRHPVTTLFERTLLPIGPITRQAPRWVIEGYATLLEGQLTGLGRPHSDMRAAILRRWAQEGQLPRYDRLSTDDDRWHGMSMAYLAGSAYLEWLVARSDPGSLRRLWARMTARTVRSFDAAFRGVFGDSPEALYGRFTAELTERAMRAEALIAPAKRDGVLWQRLERSTGVPAVSPDGTKLAVVVHARRRPARLVVFPTGTDEDAERRYRERIDRMLAEDPEDHPPVRAEPLPRTELHVLPAINGGEPHAPRWMPDGASILYVRYEPDREGFLHPDLFRWHVENGLVERITRVADLHSPDPTPDGRSAFAVRRRHGLSGIVRVDLATGTSSAVLPPSPDVAYDSPRVSPDGKHLVYLRTGDNGWRGVVRTLRDGAERFLETPAGVTLAHPAWSRDGRAIYLSVGMRGHIDIHAFPAAEAGPGRAITRSQGAALGAAPAADGLFFLNLEPRGLDLRLVQLAGHAEALPDLPATLVPAVPLPAEDIVGWDVATVPPGRPVALGRQEFLPIIGGAYASSARAIELGVRGGDLLGRLDYIALGSLAGDGRGPAGGALAAVWRGWPVSLGVHVFAVDEDAPAHPLRRDHASRPSGGARRGVEVEMGWQRRGRPSSVYARGGTLLGSAEPAREARAGQQVGFAQGGWWGRLARDRWHASYAGDVRLDSGRTGDQRWQRLAGAADAGVGYGSRRLGVHIERRSLYGNPTALDAIRVGGMPSSVLPSTLDAGRRHAPALPLATLTGDHHRALRIDLSSGAAQFFYERHQVRLTGTPWDDAVAWIGGEIRISTSPAPLLLLPGADVLAGVARVLDAPAESRFRWWVGVRWRP